MRSRIIVASSLLFGVFAAGAIATSGDGVGPGASGRSPTSISRCSSPVRS